MRKKRTFTKYSKQVDKASIPSLDPVYFPKAKLSLGAEGAIPINSKVTLLLQLGYEMHAEWDKDINKERSWSKPLNLQSFTGQISLSF